MTEKNFQETMEDKKKPFVSREEKEKLRSGLVSAFTAGVRIAAVVAPIAVALGIGKMIGNVFSGKD